MANTNKSDVLKKNTNVNSEKKPKLHEENTENLEEVSEEQTSKLTKDKQYVARVSGDMYILLNRLKDQRNFESLNDVITELYNSNPWHVLTCEQDQKRLYDSGLVVSTREDLTGQLDKERARYYVLGVNKTRLEDLPQGVRDMIHVK